MNRRGFFKALAGATAAVCFEIGVASSPLAQATKHVASTTQAAFAKLAFPNIRRKELDARLRNMVSRRKARGLSIPSWVGETVAQDELPEEWRIEWERTRAGLVPRPHKLYGTGETIG